MVIPPAQSRQRGWLIFELAIAIAILGLAMLPLAFSFNSEQKLLRAHYFRAIAMEIIDGEMEILRAGQWRAVPEGEHPYSLSAQSASNLSLGQFITTRGQGRLRLEWRATKRSQGGSISRELLLPGV